jgi:hypothetical protein
LQNCAYCKKLHAEYIFFENQKTSYINLPFWESFEDKHLTNYILLALKNNHSVKSAFYKSQQFLDYTVSFSYKPDKFASPQYVARLTVISGNTISAPLYIPKYTGYMHNLFYWWENENGSLAPGQAYTPTRSTSFSAYFGKTSDDFYNHNRLDRSVFSELIIHRQDSHVWVYIAKPGAFSVRDMNTNDGGRHTFITCEPHEYYYVGGSLKDDTDIRVAHSVLKCVTSGVHAVLRGSRLEICLKEDDYCYTNGNYTGITGHWQQFQLDQEEEYGIP